MNMPLNLRALLKHAEAAKSADAWEALARNLLMEKGLLPKRSRAKAHKIARPKARTRAAGLELTPAMLTLTECRAQGIAPPRVKFGGGSYVHVLVTFRNGVRILAGQYPIAKDAADRSAAIGNARARYLLTMSGGVFMDAKAKIPQVATVRDIVDAAELEQLRESCSRQRAAFETFHFAPYWDGDMPRGVDWVAAARRDAMRIRPDGSRELDPKWEAIGKAYLARPHWHRATFTS